MSVIAAISTPIGAGGIGIVRASGEGALEIADAIFSLKHPKNKWEPLRLQFGEFKADGFSDLGYAVYFPADRAYTGEDTVEFYLHGGVRIMQGALDTLLSHGAVLAKNGEFTKKAFLAGRLSLADAEGVIDMINADSKAALNAAFRLMRGDVSKRIYSLEEELGKLIAGLEATLDYPEEMEDEVLPSLPDELKRIADGVSALLFTARQGRIAKYGLRVALIGAANAGKSSLFNAIIGQDRAIVTSRPGTTRDTIEAEAEFNGVKLTLVDTAGIRESDDEIENEGVERAKRECEGADVILHVIDRTQPDDGFEFPPKYVFDVYTKADVTGFRVPRKAFSYAVSVYDEDSVRALISGVTSLYCASSGGEVITNERHVSALYQALSALKHALYAKNDPIDCILVRLRGAYDALGEITGNTASESIIDEIFSRFCVGK